MPATAPVPREPVKCALPGCKNTFIPRDSRNLYCSYRCRRRFNGVYRLTLLQGGRR